MADWTYENFDLRIERRAAAADGTPRYRAAVIASPVGEANAEFALAIPQDAAIAEAGRRLFEAAFSGEVLTALRRSLDRAGRRRAGLRIRLRLADAAELADLPWEALYDPERGRFLTLSAETPIVRYLDLPEAIEPLKATPPLRILPVMASPRDLPALDRAGELALLRRGLDDLLAAGLIEIEPRVPATVADLRATLRRRSYHILHFLGHGDVDPDSGEGFLVMEDRDGRGRPIAGHALAALLGDQRTLRLVVLNACRGATAAAGHPFASVAGRLVQQAIPAVVAMRTAIRDEAAVAFAHEFYAALADGYAVDAAVAEARKALFAEGEADAWAAPVLFMRATDGRIFDLASRQSDTRVGAHVPPASPPASPPAPPKVGGPGGRGPEGRGPEGRELGVWEPEEQGPEDASLDAQRTPQQDAPHVKQEPAYAAFISYAPADRQWVLDTLLPQIEQAGHRVIVDVRDFPAGSSRADAIAWAVANSRHTIAVLTPAYVAGEWQALETLAARTADPAAWRRQLLPLRLKPCATPAAIAAIALDVADLTDPYAAPYALARLLQALTT